MSKSGSNVKITALVSCIIIIAFFYLVSLAWPEPAKDGTYSVASPIKLSDETGGVPAPNPDGIHHPLQYTEEGLSYLTEALYYESQGESLECQEMVAHVIVNRKYDWSYPNSIKEVVWEPSQFSYTQDGKHERMNSYREKVVAGQVAHLVLSGLSLDRTDSSLFYHNPNLVNWEYKENYTFVIRCGNHDFYKTKGAKDF